MKLPVHLLALLAAVPVFAQDGATPADKITVAPGFKVELLKSADKRDGSWISMAIDDKGRLYISPQGAIPESGFSKDNKWGGLVRVTLDDKGHIAKWERVPLPIGDAMGMLWAFDSLYVSGQGPEGRGIYRLMSEGTHDHLDTWVMWKKVPGGAGEHGAHALVLGPDGKSIYIVHGNSTPLIDGIDPNSPYKNYAEDDLLPRVMDPVATFFDKIKTPYGYVLRTDEQGSKWELLAGGFRNPYDIDFNADGELFTYDSDMEWDVGLPWYRPTRVLHVVPGGEYGFREGSAKWPAWYPDSLPAAVDIGLGCPTGVKFGTRSNFPEKYRRAFFIMDWTFGRILAVHLHPRGASYTASSTAVPAVGPAGILPVEPPARTPAGETPAGPTGWKPVPLSPYSPTSPQSGGDVEVFVTGKGLPVTDLEFGNDGAMYFTIGGRGTQAGLYRVSYVGPNPGFPGITREPASMDRWNDRPRGGLAYDTDTELVGTFMTPAKLAIEMKNPADAERLSRAFTERLYNTPKYNDLISYSDLIGSADPFLQTVGRLHLENLPPKTIRERFEKYGSASGQLTALLALARVGTKEDQAAILQALAKFPLDSLSEELKLDKLRVITVALARHGRPSPELAAMGLEKLSRQYPAKTFALNRELCQLLVYLAQPTGDAGNPPAATGRPEQPTGASGAATRPPGEATRPSGEATRPSGEATRPSGEATRPSGEATRPSGEATRPSGEATRPSGEATRPSGEATRPSGEAARPSGEAARPSGEGTRASGEDVTKSLQPTRQTPLAKDMASEVIERTLILMDESPETAEQVWYALCLREAAGWTPAQRERYFAWFAKARNYKGGNSFAKFILRIRDQALEKVPAADRPALLALAEKAAAPSKPAAAVPPRAFVKAWTLADLLPALPEADKGRNFARGKALYTAAQCAQCHKFAGDGGATGPDLTAVGSRFSRRDILEATLEPSKALSEQYASFLFTLKDGRMVGGQIAEENHYLLTLITDPLRGTKQNFMKGDIAKREMSPVSLMPPGLLSTLTKDEVLDLLAYLESAGNEQAPAFAR